MTLESAKTASDLFELSKEHPYYCSEGNYYSNKPNERYESLSDFLDDFEMMDVDLNYCFRWDVKDKSEDFDEEGYYAEVFLMLQRKGIFKPCFIENVFESEVERFIKYLAKHQELTKKLWNIKEQNQ